MRLIDADALEKAIYEWMPKDQETWMESDIPPIENLVVSIMMTIEEQPTVDAREVQHGKWLPAQDYSNGNEDIECSNCGEWFKSLELCGRMGEPNYCPVCGAKMDE